MTFEKVNLGTEPSTALDAVLFAHAEDDAAVEDYTPGTHQHRALAEEEFALAEVGLDDEVEGLLEYMESDDNRTVGVSLEALQSGTESVDEISAEFVGLDQALKLRGATE